MKKSMGAIVLALFVTAVMVTGVWASDNQFKAAIAERYNTYQENKSEVRESTSVLTSKESEYDTIIQGVAKDKIQTRNEIVELIQL